MARRTAEQLGAAPTITAHLDRRAALDGADFVINMIQVGGHAATLRDFEIPARYGLRQTIADTLGIGGIFRALRTIPVHARDRARHGRAVPGRVAAQLHQPDGDARARPTRAGSPHTKVVGLCHSVQHTTRELAELVGVPFEEVTFPGAGVNHQALILRFERDGEDLYPRLDEAIAADPELRRRVRVELYRRLGYFPTESSEHSAEYLPWLHARRRGDRAVPHPGRRVRPPSARRTSTEYDELKAAAARPASGFEIERERRVRAADHPRDGHRAAARHLRQRAQRRA